MHNDIDKTTALLIAILGTGFGLFCVYWIIIREDVIPWVKKKWGKAKTTKH